MSRGRSARSAPLGFTWRLFVSLGLVVLACGVTLLGVALVVAPQIFQGHLRAALGASVEPAVQRHVDEAFADAMISSMGIALPVALLVAFAVTWVVAQRLGRSVAAVAAAADRIARGDLAVRVEVPAVGPELALLAEAFNAMAGRLADSETMRSRLIGDLAHELRTPLASIEATVEAVVDGVLPADGATLATLVDQTGRLKHLVADMAAVSRAEERQLDLHPRPVDLGALSTDAVAAAGARFAAAGVRLDVEVVEEVREHLDNALRHTPRGAQSASPSARGHRVPSWRSPTPVRGSTRPTASASSSGSTAPTPRGRGPRPGAASA
jgi:two-component system sensor histidine kinase BaeS